MEKRYAKKKKQKFYAVKAGFNPGIYDTWDECQKEVKGYPKAVYKSFPTRQEAEDFIAGKERKFDLNDFPSTAAVAYVDGSFKGEEYSYGAVFFYQGKEEHFGEKFADQEMCAMHNVAGEIMGSRKVMEICLERGITELYIHHDYEGIAKWCTGAWQANRKGTQDYRDYYNSIKGRLKVEFIKVKGHSGDKYNELADQLAKKALGIW